jgi:hypothetical protein
MSLKTLTSTALTRLFSTPGGRRVLADLEKEADEHEQNLVRRQKLVRDIEEARRWRAEEEPPLRARVTELEAEWTAARKAADAARIRWADARGNVINRSSNASHTIDRSQNLLRRSADPRLCEVAERLHSASHNWGHIWNRLAQRETVGEFMEAYTRIRNQTELDALRTRLDELQEAVDQLCLLAEPQDADIVRVVEDARELLSEVAPGMPGPGGWA